MPISRSMQKAAAGNTRVSFYEAISELSLTANLKVCLDAGATDSYGGSGQYFYDLTSNNTDFYLGTSSSPTSESPTFNGTAGNLSSNEYFSFDGGDYFRLASSNPAWVDNIHKDNAKYTIIIWAYVVTRTGANDGWIGTAGGQASRVGWQLYNGDRPGYLIWNGGPPAKLNYTVTADPAMSNGTWNMFGNSIDEAGGSVSFAHTNGAYEVQPISGTNLFNGSYSSPSSGSASYTLEIGANGGGYFPLPSGTRLSGVMVWEGTQLGISDVTNIYNATKGRFGL